MIKFLLPILLLASANLIAQTNTFPPYDNVGIGTLSPENSEGWQRVLEVKAPECSKILTSTNSIITGMWSHAYGFYGAPAGGITGTFSAHPYSFITNKLTRMVISASGSVGIGTVAPLDLLELDAGNTRRGLTLRSQGDADAYSDIQFQVKDGTSIPAGRPYAWIISQRKDGFFSNSDSNGSSLEFFGAMSESRYFAPLSFKSNGDVVLVSDKNAIAGNVGIGTTSPREKLSVNGNIRSKEIKVETNNWPDYVFEKNYQSTSLLELERYIKTNKHLPEIPSAKEVKENGISLGEMNAKLLKKIEELTLHLIEKDKQLINLEERVVKMEKRANSTKN